MSLIADVADKIEDIDGAVINRSGRSIHIDKGGNIYEIRMGNPRSPELWVNKKFDRRLRADPQNRIDSIYDALRSAIESVESLEENAEINGALCAYVWDELKSYGFTIINQKTSDKCGLLRISGPVHNEGILYNHQHEYVVRVRPNSSEIEVSGHMEEKFNLINPNTDEIIKQRFLACEGIDASTPAR